MKKLFTVFTILFFLVFMIACNSKTKKVTGEENPFDECDPEEAQCSEGELCIYSWKYNGFFCQPACDPESEGPCENDFTCESVKNETLYGCFPPLSVSGRIFDFVAEDQDAIEGAHVVGKVIGKSDSPPMVISDNNGKYTFILKMTRKADGTPFTNDAVNIFVSADGYESYPGLIRPSLPVTFEKVSCSVQGCFVMSAFTDIGLFPLDTNVAVYRIEGSLSDGYSAGLVVAECNDPPCPFSYPDENGDFTIFNVPAGDYTVKVYSKGKNYSTEEVTVIDENITGLDLEFLDTPLSTLNGQVNIVAAGGGKLTSIVMSPVSTFITSWEKGVLVPGLRAPDQGIDPNISGAYTISGIPDGEYYILAAFENDFLVRDPDPNIAGTQLVKVKFPGVGDNYDVTIGNFKITSAVEIVFPGATEPELVSSNPTFIWKMYPSAQKYDITVYNSQGIVQWEKEVASTGDTGYSVEYDGPPLSGYYQWVVMASKASGPISMSEDLLGIFFTSMQY